VKRCNYCKQLKVLLDNGRCHKCQGIEAIGLEGAATSVLIGALQIIRNGLETNDGMAELVIEEAMTRIAALQLVVDKLEEKGK